LKGDPESEGTKFILGINIFSPMFLPMLTVAEINFSPID